MKLLKDESAASDEHPIDRHYRQLACDIRPLDKNHPTVQLVKDYVKLTAPVAHSCSHLPLSLPLCCPAGVRG